MKTSIPEADSNSSKGNGEESPEMSDHARGEESGFDEVTTL